MTAIPLRRPSRSLALRATAMSALAASMFVAPQVLAATINGTPEADVLHGTATADVIRAGAGNDEVFAGRGGDRVYPGAGNDIVHLGPGADRVVLSDDAIFGKDGRDWVYGGTGADVTHGVWNADLGPGDDRYLPRWACLEVRLGDGDDVAENLKDWGGLGGCTMYGGRGADLLRWDGTDAPHERNVTTLDGGDGADTIYGGYNEDHLIGGDGPDKIVMDEFQFTDHVFAGPGNDVIHTIDGDGTAPIRCGPGIDTVIGWVGQRVLRDCEIKES